MRDNPSKVYKEFLTQNPKATKYDTLLPQTDNKESWSYPIDPRSTLAHKESLVESIQATLADKGYGIIATRLRTDSNKTTQFVLQLVFSSSEEAAKFNKSQCEDGCAVYSPDKKTLSLSQQQAETILTHLGLTHYNNTPIQQALQNEYKQKTSIGSKFQFFRTTQEHINTQLIKTLNTLPEANASFFVQQLIESLKTLSHNEPLVTLSKIKEFSQNFSEVNTIEKNSNTELVINLILNSETKTLSDLIEQLNTAITQETVSNNPTP